MPDSDRVACCYNNHSQVFPPNLALADRGANTGEGRAASNMAQCLATSPNWTIFSFCPFRVFRLCPLR